MGLSSTYLETLPGYVAAAFDDQGNEAPPGPERSAARYIDRLAAA